MKQKIDPKDIRKGDLIREERKPQADMDYNAVEYVASTDGEHHTTRWGADHYLLERPEPPFEPYWGLTIRHPKDPGMVAYYLPDSRRPDTPWIVDHHRGPYWGSDDWAKRKLAGGWVVIAPSEREEGVK